MAVSQGLNNVRQGIANRDQNYPARAGKGSAFMGGVREPMMVYWPGVTKPGTECEQKVIIEDFFPTILEMAGVRNYKTIQKIDGKSFVKSVKKGKVTEKDKAIVWHFPNLWGETQNKEEGYGAYSAEHILQSLKEIIILYIHGKPEFYAFIILRKI